jgi:mono/diheme cytochrome c family protein
MRWLWRVGTLCLVVSLAGAPLASAADLTAAHQDYDRFCAVCHGPKGKGDGPAGMTLSPHPRDFTDCARMKKMTDETLFKAIKDGGPAVGLSSSMPAWSSGLKDEQIHGLVAYVRSFCSS